MNCKHEMLSKWYIKLKSTRYISYKTWNVAGIKYKSLKHQTYEMTHELYTVSHKSKIMKHKTWNKTYKIWNKNYEA